MSSEHALEDQIIQRLYCDRYEPFPPKLNGQYIKQNNKRTIVAIATSDSPLYEPFDQRPSGEKYDPDYRDLCWARVWKLRRGPPDRSLAKRIMDAERLAPIKEARRGIDVPFATKDWYESELWSETLINPPKSNSPHQRPNSLRENLDSGKTISSTLQTLPRLRTPSTHLEQKTVNHSQLLEDFKNYYISNQVEITEHDTILHVIRTYHGMSVKSEYHIVECLHLSDTTIPGLPKAIVALYHVKTPENEKPYLDRALFVQELSKTDSIASPARGQRPKARFLSIAEDLEEEISYRFYVPGGQNSGPLYGQYIQDNALDSVDIEQLDQGRVLCKSTAVVWRKREPLQHLRREEWERNNIALRRVVEERRLCVKYLEESHESSVAMRHRGRG
ncbi:hypothetical protein ACHAPG_000003 [Botrytis cinerea]